MTAEIIQFVPRPNPDRDRKLAEEAAKILAPFVETTGYTDTSPSEMNPDDVPHEINAHTRHLFLEKAPFGGAGIDGMWKDTDPA